MWDRQLCKKNWSKEIKQLLIKCNMEIHFTNMNHVDLNTARNILSEQDQVMWINDMQTSSKLQTYSLFKDAFVQEPYLCKVQNRQHRSVLAQLRCGILPLKIETGRYQNIPKELRLCTLCEENVIENEIHFLLYCSKYDNIRTTFYNAVNSISTGFQNLDDIEKLRVIMTPEIVCCTAEYIWNCFNIRKSTLYLS